MEGAFFDLALASGLPVPQVNKGGPSTHPWFYSDATGKQQRTFVKHPINVRDMRGNVASTADGIIKRGLSEGVGGEPWMMWSADPSGQPVYPLQAFTWGNRTDAAYQAIETAPDASTVQDLLRDTSLRCLCCHLSVFVSGRGRCLGLGGPWPPGCSSCGCGTPASPPQDGLSGVIEFHQSTPEKAVAFMMHEHNSHHKGVGMTYMHKVVQATEAGPRLGHRA